MNLNNLLILEIKSFECASALKKSKSSSEISNVIHFIFKMGI